MTGEHGTDQQAKAPNTGGQQVECHELQADSYYRTGAFLRAKHRLARYDSGRQFQTWALGHIAISPGWSVLDAGCGWGRFTWSLVDDYHLPAVDITCCDVSDGMLQTAREEALRRKQRVKFIPGSIEALPMRSSAVDLSIAGHVLYHLSNIHLGIHELARVIRDDGYALVTTNSDKINPLVVDLHYRSLETLGIPYVPEPPSRFSLENGGEYLSSAFKVVEARYFEDSSTFQDVPTFLEGYVTIGRYRMLIDDQGIPLEKRQRLAKEVRRQAERFLEAKGALRSPVLMGAFVCREPIR